MKELRSTLGKIKGLGSSNEGSKHWWTQRVLGIALVPLIIWLIFASPNIFGTNLGQFKDWLGGTGNAVFLCLFIFTALAHGQLGMQVIIEDYINSPILNTLLILVIKGISVLVGTFSIFVIIKLSLGS